MKNDRLLEIDGLGNVLLGLPLLLFPQQLDEFLGLPSNGENFFPTILGAVFVGIGAALILERVNPSLGGLGIGGAMVINLIFGIVLVGWLLLSGVILTSWGSLLMWLLAAVLIGISTAEAISLSRQRNSAGR
jgi:hypothetical protein